MRGWTTACQRFGLLQVEARGCRWTQSIVVSGCYHLKSTRPEVAAPPPHRFTAPLISSQCRSQSQPLPGIPLSSVLAIEVAHNMAHSNPSPPQLNQRERSADSVTPCAWDDKLSFRCLSDAPTSLNSLSTACG
ncbi:hypothetical protein LshimejAT787_1802430 [Lyophyllum shimeji]|uniref:Uncharacterized protein n=1 Tax=Lyophyllum shimeji TaxID=47721 RepID=A0A9P3UW97_LYOSH|nr:hypothetical protein LshimejAT787_1802430 [Lyophyllum shimeji]